MDHMNRTAKRRSVIFLISDFQDQDYRQPLRIATRKHDIIPIVVDDQIEREVPNIGLLELCDSETGETVVFDTTSRKQRVAYTEFSNRQRAARERLFRELGMDPIYIHTGQDMIDPLRRFFHKRETRR